MLEETINKGTLHHFLATKARVTELGELAKILKCPASKDRQSLAKTVVVKLYQSYQTPIGYIVKQPTLDAMCDRIAKKLKLAKLEGAGWCKLRNLSISVFEKILKSMSKEEKKKLLTRMWNSLDGKERKKIKDEFHVADVNSFVHSSEMLVAHVVGVHLARETAIYTAAAIVRIYVGTELALAASTVLTRTATVFLGPVGWALLAVSVNDLMGTNYKKVVPTLLTINIISMRVHNKPISKNDKTVPSWN